MEGYKRYIAYPTSPRFQFSPYRIDIERKERREGGRWHLLSQLAPLLPSPLLPHLLSPNLMPKIKTGAKTWKPFSTSTSLPTLPIQMPSAKFLLTLYNQHLFSTLLYLPHSLLLT